MSRNNCDHKNPDNTDAETIPIRVTHQDSRPDYIEYRCMLCKKVIFKSYPDDESEKDCRIRELEQEVEQWRQDKERDK